MKRIIMTGATSMLGTSLTEIAVRKGVEVYAIVRSNTNRIDRIIKSPLVHIVYSTLDNLKNVKEIPRDCDVLYHFAWAGTGKEQRGNPLVQEENIKYTLNAVELAERTGCQCFVFAGSQAEYGPVYEIINEKTVPSPVSSYGISKYAAGLLSKIACETRNIKHIWGRVFSVYGPHDNKGTMIDYAMNCFFNNKTAHFSSGEQYWNYLYESDAGELFYRLGLRGVPSGIYCIANTESRKLRDYIQTMIKECGDFNRIEFDPEINSRIPGLNVDMTKTVKTVDYVPKVKFEDGIRKVIQANYS